MSHEVYELGGKKTSPMESTSVWLSATSFTPASSTNSLQTRKERTKSLTSVPQLFSHWRYPAAPAEIRTYLLYNLGGLPQ